MQGQALSPWLGHVVGSRRAERNSVCGDWHLIPLPPLGSWAAYLSFLNPGPVIPGLPRGGDYVARCPSLWATSRSQAGEWGRWKAEQFSGDDSLPKPEDRLTCPFRLIPLIYLAYLLAPRERGELPLCHPGGDTVEFLSRPLLSLPAC